MHLSRNELQLLQEHVDELTAEEIAGIEEALDRLVLEEARESLLAFCRYMDPEYRVGRHHRVLAKHLMALERGEEDRVIVNLPPRHGKQLAHDTLVPTPQGYRRHGDLRVGDHVFGPDGLPTRVVAVSEESLQDVEVEFTNGEIVRCHENHEWAVFDRRGRWLRPRVLETRELERDVWIGSAGARGGRARWQLPDAQALQYPTAVQPLHPYVLGVWLGDGTTTKPTIAGIDEEIFAEVSRLTGFRETGRYVHATTGVTTGVTTAAFAGPRPNVRGQLSEHLHALGLLGNKHIPEVYLRGDVEQRRELLAGLMDTDGHVDPHTGRCRFVTGNPRLADDVFELVASLGYRPYRTVRKPALSSSGIQGRRDILTIAFRPVEPLLTRLERKQVRRFAMRRKVAIRAIRRVAPHLGRCIQVERADGLYLVGRQHIVTHNSQLTSIYFPAWFIGRNPTRKLMLVSHTADLAVDFGRKVRNLIDDPKFRAVFPDVHLSADSKSAGRWDTNRGGTFYATGVGSSLAGRGADMLIVDDPHSEQDVLTGTPDAFDRAYRWFTFGARTRLMPGGRVAVVSTRWHVADLSGRLVQDMAASELADRYRVIEFPALFEVPDPDNPDGPPVEKALWPEFFDVEALRRTRASMPAFQWSAQYQQNPVAEGATLVRREWWRTWEKPDPPECDYVMMTLDTATEVRERSNYSALTVWGVFRRESGETGETENHLILLEAVRRRVEFPELKSMVVDYYRRWEPDAFIVEKKNAGVSLYQELRRTGVPVQEYTPHRGSGNKYARLNSVADIVASGIVWVPRTRWAEELVEEIAAFPSGEYDDYVDATVMALMRFRQGGFISLRSDDGVDMNWEYVPYRAAYY